MYIIYFSHEPYCVLHDIIFDVIIFLSYSLHHKIVLFLDFLTYKCSYFLHGSVIRKPDRIIVKEEFMVNMNAQLDINVPIKYGALFKIMYDSI